MKKLWIITGAIVVLGLAGTSIYVQSQKAPNVISPSTTVAATPTPSFELTTWKDQAGFSFQYPKELAVNKHEEDNDNYAHVELTHKDHPGKIIVWVKDLPAGVTTLDSWVKKLYPDATSLDTKLGGEPAKKILSTAPVKMLTTGAISDNLLFYIEGALTDSDYWSRVHDTITGSFAFIQDTAAPATAGSASGGASGGDEVDETEVVQ
jgi:hypothetical protein